MVALFSLQYACSDNLETNPTDKTSGTTIFADDKSAEVALNGIYRAMYVSGWTGFNTAQNFGNMSTSLYADLMGEDMIQLEQGSGWFSFDYNYDVRSRYNNDGFRPYASWNYYYTLISNANYIIANDGKIGGDPMAVKNIVGQAYAIRGFCYFMLIQTYQQTYIGHENLPGVPVYTEPTTSASVGKSRGTVQEVYTQINSDIDHAITLLKESGIAQKHISHIDQYVAQLFKARVALVQNQWQVAADAAAEAMKKPSCSVLSEDKVNFGFNDYQASSAMWAAQILSDQSSIWASFYSHMDASVEQYANKSRKCISSWLYNQLPDSDARKDWWMPKLAKNAASGVNASYCQLKFRYKDPKVYTGDYLFARLEEAVLTQAEALCRLKQYTPARQALSMLGNNRDANYATRLAKVSDSDVQTFASTGTVTTLMDEILVQRRIELWGEAGRIFDILRLAKGFTRDFADSNHPNKLEKFGGATAITPDYKEFIMTIPQTEIDGNPNVTAADQNPL